jgi:histidyl-tRNA synthetase
MPREAGPLSGFRDMLAEQKIPRDQMIDTIKGVYENYGFTPLDTPIIERYETLTGKYGDEGEQLMYKFTDHGGRLLALRYDLTVPLARVVAQHGSELPMPYKRYQTGPVFRGESPQAGRYREFVQFDADIVGTNSTLADAEVVAMMSDTMNALGADAVVRVNNRRLLDALVEKAGVEDPKEGRFLIGAIDKVEKIGTESVITELSERFDDDVVALVQGYLDVTGDNHNRIRSLSHLLADTTAAEEGTDNLERVFSLLENAGYNQEQVQFDQTIARGLNYYTGIIYETQLKGMPRIGSVCSGGRYDNLVKDLGGPDLPAVGTSVGVDRLFTALHEMGKLDEAKTPSEVMVVNFDSNFTGQYMKIASELRKAGVPTDINYDGGRLGKQLRGISKLGIPYAVIIGSTEMERKVAIVRDMNSGEQHEVPLENLTDFLNTIRREK